MLLAEPTVSSWKARLALDFAFQDEKTVLAGRSHDGPLVVQKPLYPEGREVCHAIVVHPPGGIAGGDELSLQVKTGNGASTLLKRHVSVTGDRIELAFRGKAGKDIACAHSDPALARALKRLASLPGPRLFQYRREDGAIAAITASEINAYLKSVSGLPISSKDLRMLAANAAAAELLLAGEAATTETGRKRQLSDIMRAISERLVNTPSVVRKSYVHAIVVASYASGKLQRCFQKSRARAGCSRIERALGLLAR